MVLVLLVALEASGGCIADLSLASSIISFNVLLGVDFGGGVRVVETSFLVSATVFGSSTNFATFLLDALFECLLDCIGKLELRVSLFIS